MYSNTLGGTARKGLAVPMLPTLRYVLSALMLVGAGLAGTIGLSFVLDPPQNVDTSVPLTVFCAFFVYFLYLAWRSWSTGAVVDRDEVIFRGAWRSAAVKRSMVVGVRVEPLIASLARRYRRGQLMMTHEVVVDLKASATPLRLSRVGFAFMSEDGAAQFAQRVQAALTSPATPEW